MLEALKDINPEANVASEEDDGANEDQFPKLIEEIENQDHKETLDAEETNDYYDETEDRVIGKDDAQTIVMKSIQSVEEAWDDAKIKQEKVEREENPDATIDTEVQPVALPSGHYITRSGRISRPPNHLIETAYAILSDTYVHNYHDVDDDEAKATVECTFAMKALLFQKAVEQKPKEVMRALKEEVLKAVKIDIWEPIHPREMSEEDCKMIIPQMMNYLEKFKPDMSFDKYKVRVLTRGDKQIFAGESEGPVARVESLLMLLDIAAHQDMMIFKVDIGLAFMRTPMAEDVKHKWVKLDKRVVKILLELQPEKYQDYVLPDDKLVVKMKKLSYGYVEAAHYWWKDLTQTFKDDGYSVCNKDKCVFIKRV